MFNVPIQLFFFPLIISVKLPQLEQILSAIYILELRADMFIFYLFILKSRSVSIYSCLFNLIVFVITQMDSCITSTSFAFAFNLPGFSLKFL